MRFVSGWAARYLEWYASQPSLLGCVLHGGACALWLSAHPRCCVCVYGPQCVRVTSAFVDTTYPPRVRLEPLIEHKFMRARPPIWEPNRPPLTPLVALLGSMTRADFHGDNQ